MFLIDDSDSMEKHWKDVKTLFGVLCYLVKTSDKDGVDLFFTRHGGEYNSCKRTELAQHLERRLDGPSDMEKSLKKILERHAQELINESKPKTRFGRKRQAMPMNIYVLTDAAWHSRCNASAPIQDFIDALRQRWDGPPPGGWSGVQFISFGDDRDALACLDSLDTFLDLRK